MTHLPSMLVGDIVLGTPAALGHRVDNISTDERACRYLGMVVGKTQLLSYRLPALVILYEVGVYEIFNCEAFFQTHIVTPFNAPEFMNYRLVDTITLLHHFTQGVFDDVLNTEVREKVLQYVMEKDEL